MNLVSYFLSIVQSMNRNYQNNKQNDTNENSHFQFMFFFNRGCHSNNNFYSYLF